MKRSRLLLLALVLAAALGSMLAAQGARPAGLNYKGPAFTITKIADGVYHAVGTGALVVMCNASIIETDRELIVVDTHVTPGGAWALREELKAITPKPIKFVVNSHFHFDHSHGNQIYGPDVEIIGHEFTRQQILAGNSVKSRALEFFVGGVPNQIAGLKERIAKAADAAERDKLQAQLAIQENHLEGTKAVVPTAPNVTLTDALTIHRGGREIRILHLGRGHTAGDVVVHLPKERIVITGDLIVEGTSYMGDAFFTDWIATMDRVKALDFDTTLPGHGRPFQGKAKYDHWQAYLRDFWTQAQTFHKSGVPWEEAAKRVDLRGNAANYPTIRTPGITPNHGMLRAYEILDGKVR